MSTHAAKYFVPALGAHIESENATVLDFRPGTNRDDTQADDWGYVLCLADDVMFERKQFVVWEIGLRLRLDLFGLDSLGLGVVGPRLSLPAYFDSLRSALRHLDDLEMGF